MIDCYTGFAYIVVLVCMCPLFILCCGLKRVRHWYLTVCDYVLKRRVKRQQEQMEKTHYHTVYLNEDEEGAYILLNEQKIHLKAMKAKPLHGFLAGSTYYTTNESEKLVPIVPKKRF